MRRILIQIGLLVMPILCLAQVSKQQAIETVMNTMINRDSVRVNVNVEPLLQTNEFYKLSPYDSISAPFIKGTNNVDEVLPIRNLSAEVLADNNVSLAWDMPSGYESGTATIGWTRSDTIGDMWQYGFDSYMAHLYDAADLKNHNGWRINSVSFYKTTTWTYSACIWKQEEGGEMSLIHSQEIAGDLPMGINEVELDADIYIMPETKYWIGLRATYNAGQTGLYPFATDVDPMVKGKGMLGMGYGTSTWDDNTGYSIGNLWLKVEVESVEGGRSNAEDELSGYRVYRNNQLIKEMRYAFVTYFTDDDFVRDVEAEYCVTAVYGESESERECATVTVPGVYEVLPVRNLSAEVLADNNVSLAWDMPSVYESGTPTITWTGNDTVGDMFQYGWDSYMAQLYDAADLKNHNGWRINSVSFYKTTTWTYSACVWKQEEGGEMSLIHSQEIAGDLPMGINEVELDGDIYIMPETKYWIGLRATLNAGQTGVYPFATDGGTVVLGKGLLGMLPDGSEWGSDSFGSVVSGNLWLKVEVEKQESDKWNVELGGNALNAYRLYRNNQLIKEIPYSFVTYFTDDNFVRDVEAEYCVTAVYGEDESERECATVTINGVQEDSAQCGVTISPNPTYGIVNIDGIMVSEATVYNALGQIIVKVFNTNVLTIEGARRGVYSMSLKDIDGNIITKKIVLK